MLSVAVSPDGAWVASGATDFGIQVSDPVTGLLQLTLKGHRNTGTSISPCSLTGFLTNRSPVTDVDFSPVMDESGGPLASASGDCTVNICESVDESLLRRTLKSSLSPRAVYHVYAVLKLYQ